MPPCSFEPVNVNSGGSFFESKVILAAPGAWPPRWTDHLPFAITILSIGFRNNPVSGLPPTRPLSTVHSPSTVAGFAGGSFSAGADTDRANPRRSVVDMAASSVFLGPLQGHDD